MALVLLARPFNLGLLLVVSFLAGCAAGLTSPAMRGLVPDVEPAHHLRPANAALGGVRSASRVLGPAVASGLAAAGHPVVGIVVDAAGFAIAAGLYGMLHLSMRTTTPTLEVAPAPERITGGHDVHGADATGTRSFGQRVADGVDELTAGWRYIRRTRWLLWSVAAATALNFLAVGPPRQVLLPALADHRSLVLQLSMVFSAKALGASSVRPWCTS